MSVPEIARRWIGGRWQTGVAEDATGGGLPAGGSTGEVLTKESNADGDVGWEPSGGSQPVRIERVPITFDMAGLAAASGASTGVVVYTPAAGELIVWNLSYFSVPTTAFDETTGTTTFNLTFTDLSGAFFNSAIGDDVDTDDADTFYHLKSPLLNAGGNWVYTTGPRRFPDTSPLRVVFDDGSAGDPGMTQGEGEFVLFIIPAAS